MSSQTAMCFGISIDTVADMVFRLCHEALPSCRWWGVFFPTSALTGGPRSPVVAWGTGPSQPSLDASSVVASLDRLIP